jgi:hypothetical protein
VLLSIFKATFQGSSVTTTSGSAIAQIQRIVLASSAKYRGYCPSVLVGTQPNYFNEIKGRILKVGQTRALKFIA